MSHVEEDRNSDKRDRKRHSEGENKRIEKRENVPLNKYSYTGSYYSMKQHWMDYVRANI